MTHARPPGLPFAARTLAQLVERHGGALVNGMSRAAARVHRVARVVDAGSGDVAPVLSERYVAHAVKANARGAVLLVDERLAARSELADVSLWSHPHAAWAFAELLDHCDVPNTPPEIGDTCTIHERACLAPRVRIGRRVTIAPGAVIGCPGFGWATGAAGAVRAVPQLGGVIIEDDVHIGANTTIDAGTIEPTIIRRGARLDAQVHVGHNCVVGEGAMLAAHVGLAGSVVIGKGVLVGGQAGFADHVTVGDGARVGAKSGVIGDIPAGAIVAGYPAVPRVRWLRALAGLYRNVGGAPDA